MRNTKRFKLFEVKKVERKRMNYESTLDVGDEIPGFDLDSQLGKIFFKDIVEAKWCLLITFPTAFDPVATTDFGLIGKLFDEFESRNILILAAGYETSNYICIAAE
jgi:alkyl hydroperoxide reductase subunit AhpC